MQRSRLFLGVDGGWSGTRALVVDESGNALGLGLGGNANHGSVGYEVAVSNVMDAVGNAAGAAGVGLQDIECAHFALAGDDVVDDHQMLTNLLAPRLGSVLFEVSNDVWAGLRAGSVDGSGIAVNCGSGAGGVGKNAAGVSAIIPDLGYVFGDSGGGEQIAEDALRAVVRAWDGRGCETALTDAVLAATGQPSTEALYLALYRGAVDRSKTRECTRMVFKLAARGDRVAIEILRRIGDEFGVTATAIARRLRMEHDCFVFVLTGGAFRTLNSPLVDAAVSRLCSTAPGCRPTLPLLMPVAGAALMALEQGGLNVDMGLFDRLASQGHGWHAQEIFGQHTKEWQ